MESETHKWLKRIALQFLREKGQEIGRASCRERV